MKKKEHLNTRITNHFTSRVVKNIKANKHVLEK